MVLALGLMDLKDSNLFLENQELLDPALLSQAMDPHQVAMVLDPMVLGAMVQDRMDPVDMGQDRMDRVDIGQDLQDLISLETIWEVNMEETITLEITTITSEITTIILGIIRTTLAETTILEEITILGEITLITSVETTISEAITTTILEETTWVEEDSSVVQSRT